MDTMLCTNTFLHDDPRHDSGRECGATMDEIDCTTVPAAEKLCGAWRHRHFWCFECGAEYVRVPRRAVAPPRPPLPERDPAVRFDPWLPV